MEKSTATRGLPLQLVAHGGAHHVHHHARGGVEVVVVVRLQCRLYLLAADIERRLVGFFRQADQHLVICRVTEDLDARVLHARRVNRLANRVNVRAVRKLHFHLRAPAKVHAQRHRTADMRLVPAHLDDAGHTENHGKGQEVPLPSQPVHIYAAKEFHCFSSLLIFEPVACRHSPSGFSPSVP